MSVCPLYGAVCIYKITIEITRSVVAHVNQ